MDAAKEKCFGGDEVIAAEYSDTPGCMKSDSGYHCSCFDRGKGCCLCSRAICDKCNRLVRLNVGGEFRIHQTKPGNWKFCIGGKPKIATA